MKVNVPDAIYAAIKTQADASYIPATALIRSILARYVANPSAAPAPKPAPNGITPEELARRLAVRDVELLAIEERKAVNRAAMNAEAAKPTQATPARSLADVVANWGDTDNEVPHPPATPHPAPTKPKPKQNYTPDFALQAAIDALTAPD